MSVRPCVCPCVCPQVAFINKLDRAGANPTRVVKDLRGKLRCVRVPAAGWLTVERAGN